MNLNNGAIVSLPDEDVKDPEKRPAGPMIGPKGGKLPGFKMGPGGRQPPGMDREGQKPDNADAFIIAGKTRKELKAGTPDEVALDSRVFESDFNIYHALGLKQTPPVEGDAPRPNQPFGPRGGANGGAQTDSFVNAWDIKTGELDKDGKPIEGQLTETARARDQTGWRERPDWHERPGRRRSASRRLPQLGS